MILERGTERKRGSGEEVKIREGRGAGYGKLKQNQPGCLKRAPREPRGGPPLVDLVVAHTGLTAAAHVSGGGWLAREGGKGALLGRAATRWQGICEASWRAKPPIPSHPRPPSPNLTRNARTQVRGQTHVRRSHVPFHARKSPLAHLFSEFVHIHPIPYHPIAHAHTECRHFPGILSFASACVHLHCLSSDLFRMTTAFSPTLGQASKDPLSARRVRCSSQAFTPL